MINNYKELLTEIDMLNGNVNRMCVTVSPDDLEIMFKHAKKRLENIFAYNVDRVLDSTTK